MGRNAIAVLMILFTAGLFLGAGAQELQILGADEVELAVGDSVKLLALYKNEMGDVELRPVSWSVEPDTLGDFSAMDFFTATHPGKGYIYARVDTLVDSVEVKVGEEADDKDDGEYPALKIKPDDIELAIGDSVLLRAVYKNEDGEKNDTTAAWSVEPDTLGYFNAMNYFIAEKAGHGIIYARLDTLLDSAKVKVYYGDEEKPDEGHLVIMPMDTIVNVGQSVQYQAYFVDTAGVYHDTTVVWSLSGNPIGSLTKDGLFFAVLPGFSLIKAKLDKFQAATTVSAIDTTGDTTGVNHVHISRVLPDGKVLPPHKVPEGGIYHIGGIPEPYQILNGGMLYFPMGSLSEDITIHIKLPSRVNIWDDSTGMEHKIVTGIQFDVLVDDTLIEPYYFERPLHVSLPFKRGILKQYGISAEDLYLYFLTDSVTFDTIGISNVYVDSIANRIFAQVEHFSTLVVREKIGTATTNKTERPAALPERFELLQNYPNPFNPATTIAFILPGAAEVTLTVYSITGQQVGTLVSEHFAAGRHEIQWNAAALASGVYYYQLVSGEFRQVKKMILLR